MTLESIITLVTILVTFLCGVVSKRSTWVSNRLIPIQNILIGVVVAGIEWIITKDFSTAIAISGLIAGGTYDIIHNLEKIIRKEE